MIYALGDRQKRQAADRFICTGCGHILGSPAIDLADIKHHESIDILQSKSPHQNISDVPQTVDAVCSRCVTQFAYLACIIHEDLQKSSKPLLKLTYNDWLQKQSVFWGAVTIMLLRVGE